MNHGLVVKSKDTQPRSLEVPGSIPSIEKKRESSLIYCKINWLKGSSEIVLVRRIVLIIEMT